jgi:hypothetical protein
MPDCHSRYQWSLVRTNNFSIFRRQVNTSLFASGSNHFSATPGGPFDSCLGAVRDMSAMRAQLAFSSQLTFDYRNKSFIVAALLKGCDSIEVSPGAVFDLPDS